VHWLLIVAIGAAVGFFGGMFGKGGSAVATPLLHAVGVPAGFAIATPLPATVPSTLAAFAPYRDTPHVDWRVIKWSIAFGLPATVVGAIATRWISAGTLVTVTELVVIGLGVRVLLTRRPASKVAAVAPSVRRIALLALAVGLASGLLANGGGFLLVPLYLAIAHLPIKPALASSLAVSAALAVPGTIVHAALGHIDWPLVLLFGLASVPLARLGATVALRADAARLEKVYGAVLVLLGVGLLAYGR
jgi:uncharacterized membrane protein YfcA